MSLQAHWLPMAELFDCLEDVVAWVKDRDGHYRWVNRAFRINLAMDDRPGSESGSGPREVIGRPITTSRRPSSPTSSGSMTSTSWPGTGSWTGSSWSSSPTG